MLHARVVDEDVERAGRLLRRGDPARDFGGVGDVERDVVRARQLGGGARGRGRVAAVHDDAAAGVVQALGERAPDPAAGAGDEGRSAADVEDRVGHARRRLARKSTRMPLNFLSSLTGSFAMPAAENPTVAMIEAAYRHHGIDARYINCEVAPAGLADAVRGARAMGWAGFNCSIPHKVAVVEHLDGLAESAAVIGAVNCVVARDGRLVGENTDGQGFMASLRTVVDPAGKRLVLFGAGGAARAIAVEAALAGAGPITVVNRDAGRGGALVALLRERTPADAELVEWRGAYRVPETTEVVVNATSVGLFPDVGARLDVDPDSLRPGMVVADVIPNPPRTALLEDAEARGCTALDGLGMLVNQGVISIRHWTGVDADPAVMRRQGRGAVRAPRPSVLEAHAAGVPSASCGGAAAVLLGLSPACARCRAPRRRS